MPTKPQSRLRTLGMAAQNALELMRYGRIGGETTGTPFDIEHEDAHYRLRHYRAAAPGPVLLLVPPLMVTADVYDIAPDISAVALLLGRGIDVWVVDFGAPERQEGGMQRTLDDHVRAVSDAIERIHTGTGRDVHVAGYSQGGMFAYQAAAYRRSSGVGSLITFGSPVDIHRNIPRLHDDLAEPILTAVRTAIAWPLARIQGLPGVVTSTAFKVVSVHKEIRQLVGFVRKLHDRQALERRERRRLFLGGAGFVAWPGPALRTFIDEIIVGNRMLSGGFVIDGRTVTLADLRCPILCFIGLRDEIARPAAVRAIRKAAPYAEVFEVGVRAGHFGMVVGSTAQAESWPIVAEWLAWRHGRGARPARLDIHERAEDTGDQAQSGLRFDLELLYDLARTGAHAVWSRLGDAARDLSGSVHDVRVQVPYLRRLHAITADTRISASKLLAEQAAAMPDSTFFLWHDRAFSYADASRRVDNVVRGLIACGVRSGQRAGVLMASRPSFLTLVAALNRLGAVAVLISPDAGTRALGQAMEIGGVATLITDPEHAPRARAAFAGPVLVLGGGRSRAIEPAAGAAGAAELIDMEAIDPASVELPSWYQPDPGCARDLAFVIVSAGRSGDPQASYVTNHRWAFSAFGAAAACMLTARDTVYSCLPLHHAAGSLVATGSALVAGARLALAAPFEPATFWPQIRRYGATVVLYANDMCRPLVDAPPHPADASHPVRLFAGSGMRIDVWRRLLERFGPLGVLELYASTEGNAVLVNAGDKIGALGQPLPASAEVVVVAWDAVARDIVTGADGRPVVCGDEPGMLLARVDETHPSRHVSQGQRASRIRRDLFAPGDAWFITGDLVRRDHDGDIWFVDRADEIVLVDGDIVATPAIEDVLYGLADIELVVVYGVELPGVAGRVLAAAVVTRTRAPLDAERLTELVRAELPHHGRPRLVRCVDGVPMTDGYRPVKSILRRAGIALNEPGLLCWDAATERYVPADANAYARAVDGLGAAP